MDAQDDIAALDRRRLVPAALLDRVVAYFRPARVILFGSRARGDHQPDSDYDLLVVVDLQVLLVVPLVLRE